MLRSNYAKQKFVFMWVVVCSKGMVWGDSTASVFWSVRAKSAKITSVWDLGSIIITVCNPETVLLYLRLFFPEFTAKSNFSFGELSVSNRTRLKFSNYVFINMLYYEHLRCPPLFKKEKKLDSLPPSAYSLWTLSLLKQSSAIACKRCRTQF